MPDELDRAQIVIESGTAAAIAAIIARTAIGESASNCRECGEPIPDRRREVVPNATRCVACQHRFETPR